jgi:hypothetical protein
MPLFQAKQHKIQSLRFFWNVKSPHSSLTNEENMLIAVFGDTTVARRTCIYCGNLRLPSSDGDSLANN